MIPFLLLQVVELQNRLSEESKKADKLEFEFKMLKEKVDSLQKEKDVCIINAAFSSLKEATFCLKALVTSS